MDSEMAKGCTADDLRANMVALQQGIVDTQLNLEQELDPDSVTFLDRAILDSLAWWRVYGLNPNDFLVECFQHRYTSVFILDRLPVQGDGLRPEDDFMAAFIDKWITLDYTALGYNVVRIPVLPPEDRMAYVLDKLSESGLLNPV